LDFSRLARAIAARRKKIRQKHGIFALIEMLDAFRHGKIDKPWTRSAAEGSNRR